LDEACADGPNHTTLTVEKLRRDPRLVSIGAISDLAPTRESGEFQRVEEISRHAGDRQASSLLFKNDVKFDPTLLPDGTFEGAQLQGSLGVELCGFTASCAEIAEFCTGQGKSSCSKDRDDGDGGSRDATQSRRSSSAARTAKTACAVRRPRHTSVWCLGAPHLRQDRLVGQEPGAHSRRGELGLGPDSAACAHQRVGVQGRLRRRCRRADPAR